MVILRYTINGPGVQARLQRRSGWPSFLTPLLTLQRTVSASRHP